MHVHVHSLQSTDVLRHAHTYNSHVHIEMIRLATQNTSLHTLTPYIHVYKPSMSGQISSVCLPQSMWQLLFLYYLGSILILLLHYYHFFFFAKCLCYGCRNASILSFTIKLVNKGLDKFKESQSTVCTQCNRELSSSNCTHTFVLLLVLAVLSNVF